MSRANEGGLTWRAGLKGSMTILLFILECHSGLDMPEARRELHASPGGLAGRLCPVPFWDFANF